MAHWYLMVVNVAGRHRRLYARAVAKRDGSLEVGIGMKAYHRSCLILTLHETTCSIESISTWTKGFVERKNPLGIRGEHLQMWLAIANDIAYLNGCSTLELFDAANVLAEDGVIQFLSRLTLLRRRQFAYEKYGFEPQDTERAEQIRATSRQLRLHECMSTKFLDDAFDAAGLSVPNMQLRFEASVKTASIVLSVERTPVRKWMKTYSDQVRDTY
jgi:hypothetical protein